jgi:hypothetical protein
MFNLGIDCPVFIAQMDAGYTPKPNQILERACPMCPKRPKRLEK